MKAPLKQLIIPNIKNGKNKKTFFLSIKLKVAPHIITTAMDISKKALGLIVQPPKKY